MPELPEVETITTELRTKINQQTITGVKVLRPSILNMKSADFCRQLRSSKILDISRRAKLIVIKLGKKYLITHLRMSGAYLLFEENEPEQTPKITRIIFNLNSGQQLHYQDQRALGKIYLFDQSQKEEFFSKYGLEPFSKKFTTSELAKMLDGRNATIKQFLLDQTKLVGIGNIYASEILFLAKINPLTKAKDLSKSKINALYKYIKQVLSDAIEKQGTTFSDYRRTAGAGGEFQNSLTVYSKKGEDCTRCKTKIKRIMINGRGTFFCPECQK